MQEHHFFFFQPDSLQSDFMDGVADHRRKLLCLFLQFPVKKFLSLFQNRLCFSCKTFDRFLSFHFYLGSLKHQDSARMHLQAASHRTRNNRRVFRRKLHFCLRC